MHPMSISQSQQHFSTAVTRYIHSHLLLAMSLALIADYLDTYHGRDKILKSLSYAAKLAAGITTSKDAAVKFDIFGSQMSNCRVILRLLDDIPMLHYTMTYGWGKEEPDWLIRWVNLILIVTETLYYPIEHVCWAGEHKIISIDTKAWENVTTWFWLVSLYLSLVKSAQRLKQLEKHKCCLGKNDCDVRVVLDTVNTQQRNELLTCVRLLLDTSYAVSYLSPGILWGGRFKTWHVGALGTLSSLISLYQAFSEKKSV